MALNVKGIATPSAGDTWDPEVGDLVRGKVILAKYMPPRENFNKDGMEQSIRIDLLTDDLDIEGNPRKVSVYAVTDNNVEAEGGGYPSRLARAIVDAVIAAGVEDLDDEGGAELAIARVEDLEPTQKGRKGAKDYRAQYTPAPKKAGTDLAALAGKAANPFEQPTQQALTSAPFVPATATPIGFQADPFAGLMGEPVPVAGLIHPKIQPQFMERASAIFGLDATALAAVTPAGLAQMVKDKGVDAQAALEVLTGLYGDHAIALAAVADAYGAPQPAPTPVDPLKALLG